MKCLLREDMLVKGQQLQEVVCTKLFTENYFLITCYFFNKVPQVNVLTQAHDCQIHDSVFYSANTVSNWLV